METNSILSANILDIIFEGRNKLYGAYELRKSYSSRIGSALGITAVAILIFAVAVSWKSLDDTKKIIPSIVDVNLSKDPEKDKILPPPPVIPKKVQVKTIGDTPPIILKDDLVLIPPPENKDFDNVRIDTKTQDGPVDNTIAPPEEIKGSQVIEVPVKKSDMEDAIIDFVQIEARFNGNWAAYLQKEIEKNMDELTEAGESGTCMVKFVVSKDGSVSNVEATTMKGTKLAEVAMNAIRKGPKWVPAMQNGNIVNAYRIQPVTFKIND